ncbi:polymer-forming cytoskeletal protein [bacterium]|nr:polymer-forming cytoskeletal protein [bacterium]
MAFSRGGKDGSSGRKPGTGLSSAGAAGVGVGREVGSGGHQAAFLGAGSAVVGKLSFTGPAVLSGEIEGEVAAESRLEVGESAVIKAKIDGSDVIVKGTVYGDIVASSKLIIFRSGKVVGNVTCASIQVEDGAVFEGSCQMMNRSSRASGSTEQNVGEQKAGDSAGGMSSKTGPGKES